MGKHTISIPLPVEDSHARLLDGLADGPDYDVVQLDPAGNPDFVGLLVDGQLRATYRKVDIYQADSLVARTILDRAADKAWSANYQVRNFNRAIRGANGMRTSVPRDVAEKPTDGEIKVPDFPPVADGATTAHEEVALEQTAPAGEPMDIDLGKTITGKQVLKTIDNYEDEHGPVTNTGHDHEVPPLPSFLTGVEVTGTVDPEEHRKVEGWDMDIPAGSKVSKAGDVVIVEPPRRFWERKKDGR